MINRLEHGYLIFEENHNEFSCTKVVKTDFINIDFYKNENLSISSVNMDNISKINYLLAIDSVNQTVLSTNQSPFLYKYILTFKLITNIEYITSDGIKFITVSNKFNNHTYYNIKTVDFSATPLLFCLWQDNFNKIFITLSYCINEL